MVSRYILLSVAVYSCSDRETLRADLTIIPGKESP